MQALANDLFGKEVSSEGALSATTVYQARRGRGLQLGDHLQGKRRISRSISWTARGKQKYKTFGSGREGTYQSNYGSDFNGQVSKESTQRGGASGSFCG